MSKCEDLHVIILASGEDHSIKSLVEALGGVDTPKQFASIAGGGTLLRQTVARYANLVPAERMIAVVTAEHEGLARTQLRDWPGIEIIARPVQCGAGFDMLLALGEVFGRAPTARVLVTPAEHYVPYPEGLVGSVVAANRALDEVAAILFGVAVDRGRGRKAWIVPGRPLSGQILSVAGLVDDASPLQAAELAAAGALWNTSTIMARIEHLWYLAARQFPMQAEAVARFWAEKGSVTKTVEQTCLDIPAIDLNRGLLAGTKNVATIAVHGSGWTDWTSPERVLDSILDARELENLLSRILRRQRASGRTQLRKGLGPTARHANAA
jgi:mannose-1-phosphate guanylyltransferase